MPLLDLRGKGIVDKRFLGCGLNGKLTAMRKKIASSILAASLAVSVLPATSPTAAAQTRATSDTGAAIERGIERAFDPNEFSSIDEGDTFTDVMKKLFLPYKDMFSGDVETSSKGFTQNIINYAIIAASVTVIGQAIQLVMANLPRR